MLPFRDFEAGLEEAREDLDFIALAVRLRPRLGDVVRWEAGGEVVDLARAFMGARSARPEAMYAILLVRVLASLERFVRGLIDVSVSRRAAAATTYEGLPVTISQRNIALTGRVLSSVDSPRDHLSFDIESLVDNLATCKAGSSAFRLNSQVFAAVVSGTSPVVVERALQNVDVSGLWDAVGRSDALSKALATKGARATGERSKERLKELWRWRNHLAHGGDQEISLSDNQLREAIAFVRDFGAALKRAVDEQIPETKGVSKPGGH